MSFESFVRIRTKIRFKNQTESREKPKIFNQNIYVSFSFYLATQLSGRNVYAVVVFVFSYVDISIEFGGAESY